MAAPAQDSSPDVPGAGGWQVTGTRQRIVWDAGYPISEGFIEATFTIDRNPLGDSDLLTAVSEAREVRVADWCFHSEAAYDLTASLLFDNLNAVELDTIDELAAAVGM